MASGGCRSYQKFLKDAEAFVLYGAPKPGAPLARNMHTARSTHDLASLAGDSVPSTWADEPLQSQRGALCSWHCCPTLHHGATEVHSAAGTAAQPSAMEPTAAAAPA